jgi:hypothetical protein
MGLRIKKQVYDNVHGYIGLTDTELRIIDTPIFQRLRQIKQLGTVYTVYPGAMHTRFAHSLGTMFMMDIFLKNAVEGEVSEEDTQKLRLAALLHDIGHYPFSHTIEKYVKERLDGISHEEFGAEIIKKIIAEKLENYRAEEITRIISGQGKKEFGMLLSSALDADKSDYMLRDSYNTGVPYGNVGIMSLLRIMRFEKDRIVFEKDESPVEHFILGRYHLYKALVYHKTTAGFDILLQRIFGFLVEEGFIADPNSLSTEDEIIGYTDDTVIAAMYNYLSKGSDQKRKHMVMMFLGRIPLKLAYSSTNFLPDGKIPKEISLINKIAYDSSLKSELARESGIDPEMIFPNVMNDLKFMEDTSMIYIRRKGAVLPLKEGNSLILDLLIGKTVYDARIYIGEGSAKKLESTLMKML